MSDDIVLNKIGETEEQKLPVGVYVITFDNRLVFARRFAGRFMLVSAQEQEELCQQFLLS